MDNWVKLGITKNQMEAEILKSYLESCGIKVLFKTEAIGKVYGLTTGPLAAVEFWVPHGQVKRARQLLEAYHDSGNNSG